MLHDILIGVGILALFLYGIRCYYTSYRRPDPNLKVEDPVVLCRRGDVMKKMLDNQDKRPGA